MMTEEQTQIEEWTQKRCNDILFDSNVHNWNENISEFDSNILNKSNLIFIVEDTNDNSFGYYFNGTVDQCDCFIKAQGSFLFSLKSNGRVEQGMTKFEEKQETKGFYLCNKHGLRLFSIQNGIYVNKQMNKNESYVKQLSNNYDFHGITQSFHEQMRENGNSCKFTPRRIIVIEMI